MFADHVSSLVMFVVDDYLPAYLLPSASSRGSLLSDSQSLSQPSSSVALKRAALKALAAACLPDNEAVAVPPETSTAAKGFMEILEG